MLSAQLEVVCLHVWQDWPSQTAFVCFLAVMRCEMEKAVEERPFVAWWNSKQLRKRS